ncbi:DUF4214 domain-containing protein [Protaetiibacter larvae]|nr:DUF4214 domain-containing protein [Protaetiibacter larvae]
MVSLEGGAAIAAGEVAVYYERRVGSDFTGIWDAPGVPVGPGGSYQMAGLPLGTYRVWFEYRGSGSFQSAYLSIGVPQLNNRAAVDLTASPKVINFTMPTLKQVSGIVWLGASDSGAAIPAGADEVEVTWARASDPGGPAVAELGRSVVTAADGSYTIPSLQWGYYTLTFTYRGSGARFDVGSAAVELVWNSVTGANTGLQRRVAYGGQVFLGSTSRPATSGEVTVGLYTIFDAPIATTSTDESGRFAFPDAPAGSARIKYEFVGTDGAFTSSTEQIRVPIAGSTTVSKVLAKSSGIAGRVTNTGGDPVADVTVYIDRFTPSHVFVEELEVVTDADGRFVYEPALAGRYRFTFVDSDATYSIQTWNHKNPYLGADYLELAAGQRREDVDVVLYRGAAIEGTVAGVLPEDLAAGLVTAELRIYSEFSQAWMTTGDPRPVAADGSFEINDLMPGTYRVDLRYRNGQRVGFALSDPIELSEGERAQYPATLVPPGFSTATTAFVRSLYEDFLGREPSPKDLAWWAANVENGAPRSAIVRSFATSDEYRLIRIDAAYEGILGRSADASGRMWWLQQMKAGRITTDDIERQFFASAEYAMLAGIVGGGGCALTTDVLGWLDRTSGALRPGDYNPWAFVRCLYADLMGRYADQAGLDYWSNRSRSEGRQVVVDALWRAPEVARSRVGWMYASYLGRSPDARGLAFWTSFIVANGDTATRAAITESEEYYNLTHDRYPAG